MKKSLSLILFLICASVILSAPAPIKKPIFPPKPVIKQKHFLVGKWNLLWRDNYYQATFYENGRYEDNGCKEGWWCYNESNGRLTVDEYWDGILARTWAVCFSVPFEGYEDCGLYCKLTKIED